MLGRFALSLALFVFAALPISAQQVTGTTGGGEAHSEMQPSLALNYIIRLTGSSNEVGEVSLAAFNIAPAGWAIADGTVLSATAYPTLAGKLGSTYGGDGTSTFALPDLRGRAVIGTGTGVGLTPRALGATTGASAISLSENQMPAHTHTLPSGGVTFSTGGNQPHSNMQPSLAMNYGVVVSGSFPSRGETATGDPFTGQVKIHAGSLPSSHVPANGQLMPISQNTALFSLYGTTYGGNGTTAFAMPDLQGRVPLSSGSGTGLTATVLGEKKGVEQVQLTTAQLPAHTHTLASGGITGSTGQDQPHQNMQPSLTLNYLIATEGADPLQQTATSQTYLGEIALFGGNFAPTGWAFADGLLLLIAEHEQLFSLLGTTYGGDGQQTFSLPDLRGRTPIGASAQWPRGTLVGTESTALTIAAMAAHVHAVPEPGFLALFSGPILIVARRRRQRC